MTDAVITANRLVDGVVVWRSPADGWVEALGEAKVFTADALEPGLVAARADIARQLIVGVYSVPVTHGENGLVPGNVREAIRSHGPSVRRDLGIQAQKHAVAG